MFKNAPRFYWAKILTGIQFQCSCTKTCGLHIQRSKTQLEKSFARKKKKKKNSINFRSKMPLGPMGQEF